MPVLLLLGSNDVVVSNDGVKRFFEKIDSKDKRLKEYKGSCHSLEFEEEAKDLVEDITGWIDEHKS